MNETNNQINWIDIQHVTFTSWVNLHLKKIGITLTDLSSGFTDGTNLIHLIDQLTLKHQRSNDGQTPQLLSPRMNTKPKIPVQMMENINRALQRLKNENINLTGITSNEINKGNLKICLALVWRLILFYQFKNKKAGDENDVMESPSKSRGLSLEKEMIGYINSIISEYTEKYKFNVNDISSSWADGKALGAVIDRLLREKFNGDIEAFKAFFNYERDVIYTDKSHAEINSHLVDVANDHLDIPELIHSNILEKGPEKLSMLTYLSYFREKGEELIPIVPQHVEPGISSPTTSSPTSDLITLQSPNEMEDQQSLTSSVTHDPTLCPNCGMVDILKAEVEQHALEKEQLRDQVEQLQKEIEILNSKYLKLEKSQQTLVTLNQEEKEKLVNELDHAKSELLLKVVHEQELLKKIAILEQQMSQNNAQSQTEISNLREQNIVLTQQVEDLKIHIQEEQKKTSFTEDNDSTHGSNQSTGSEPNNPIQDYTEMYETEKKQNQELQHKNLVLEQQLSELQEKLASLEMVHSSHQLLSEKYKTLHEHALKENDIIRKQLEVLQKEEKYQEQNSLGLKQPSCNITNQSIYRYVSRFNIILLAVAVISVTLLMSRKQD
ncbi:hypothetical protein FDP41_006354 [Naegleria fowleri]|uniref:Calponin-homology (CH) domain-containing protein n=1 Tax=Naegleria fowleri TaxID=5763 RepID=A0A6A5BLI8_NAEFO|nr:uncharacterized protein FDP41_006354 [Naegleria fowleri]KAF0974880.1 hypothetical protein FDP41_006354 [Naegleria fowleri]